MNTYDYIDTNYLHDNEGDGEQEVVSERREEADMLSRVAQWLFLGAIFVLPFIFVPIVGWSVPVGKVILTSLLGLSAGAMAFGAIVNRSVSLPRIFTASLLGVLALLTLTTLFSGLTGSSLFGMNLEVGTFFTTAIAVVLALIAPVVLTTRKQLTVSLLAVIASGAILALFHLLRLFFGPEVLALGYFFDPTTSPAGSWFDLGIFFSITYMISLAGLTFGSFPANLRTILGIVLGVSLLFVGISGLGDLIMLLGISTLVFLGISFTSPRNRSVVPGAVSVIALVLLVILSGPISDQLQSITGRYAEVKPSWSNTQEMLSAGLSDMKTAVIGKGPNTFTNLWQESRAESVINDETWWPVDFPFASGLIPTFAITFGLITTGLMMGLAIYLGVKLFVAMRDDSADPLVTTIGIASGGAALFLWVLSFFHVFSVVPFFMMFILSGIAMSAFVRAGQVSTFSLNRGTGSIKATAIVGAVVCVALMVPMVVVGTSRTIYGQALVIAQRAEDIQTFTVAQRKMRQASALERSDYFARIETELGLVRLQEILSREDFDESNFPESQQIAAEIQEAANRAVIYNDRNYLNLVNLGLVYETLGLLQVENAYDMAARSYASAQAVNPTNPALPLMRARLEILRDNSEEARALAREALEIKYNYADAYLFLADVALAEENVDGAIAQLEEAIEVIESDLNSRGNPFLHFQLGLIHYAQRDYEVAAESFTNAIVVSVNNGSEYANARYFRALSNIYGNLDREEALRDLNKIAQTNPENETLESIIENVEAGRDPLDGIDLAEEDSPLTDPETPPASNVDAAEELRRDSVPENVQPVDQTQAQQGALETEGQDVTETAE